MNRVLRAMLVRRPAVAWRLLFLAPGEFLRRYVAAVNRGEGLQRKEYICTPIKVFTTGRRLA